MEKKFDIISVCEPVMDYAVAIDRIPGTDSISKMYSHLFQSGGNAPSAITAAARLGAKCAVIGTVGNDPFGEFCREDMVYHGVDVSRLYVMEGRTQYAVCLAEKETQGRSFLGLQATVQSVTDDMLEEDFIASAKYLHLDCVEIPAKWKAAEMARRNGVLVSTDAGYYGFCDDTKLLETSDIFIMSGMYYRSLFGDDTDYLKNCHSLLSRGPKIVIVTLGSKGCAGTDGTMDFTLPAFSGYDIVDTTGAGDVFHGAFLYAHMQGWDIRECARFASAFSYINSLSLGGRAGHPTLEMVETFLETGKVDLSLLDERKAHYAGILQVKKPDPVFHRVSIRQYLDRPVEQEKIETLLRAAMAAPSATNQQPWEFYVVTDKEKKAAVASATRYASPAERAPLAFVPCIRKDCRSLPFAYEDLSAATQNILLEADALGLGTVWCGVAPDETNIANVRAALDIPDSLIPFCIIACGYAAEARAQEDRYDVSRVHYV